jgi:hypothetical protein
VTARSLLARVMLGCSGLARVPDARQLRADWPDTLRDPADGPTRAPRPLLPYLQWLAENHGVVFHGSQVRGLTELKDARQTRDESEYGDQQAVFASQDPVWALYFAVLRRPGLRSTRNGTLGPDRGVRGRRYFMSANSSAERFGPGALYVLPGDDFAHEPLASGLFDTAHRTHVGAVRPLGWFEVTPADFPLVDRVTSHDEDEPLWRTVWNSRGRARSPHP